MEQIALDFEVFAFYAKVPFGHAGYLRDLTHEPDALFSGPGEARGAPRGVRYEHALRTEPRGSPRRREAGPTVRFLGEWT